VHLETYLPMDIWLYDDRRYVLQALKAFAIDGCISRSDRLHTLGNFLASLLDLGVDMFKYIAWEEFARYFCANLDSSE
jgi:hypothetical protein